jgi:lysophospholipase L1-like esterase
VNRIVITNFDPLGYSDGYTIAAGDSIHIAMMRSFDTISATLTNYTRHYTATAGYRYLIGPPVSNAGMPNNGPYGLFFSGGVQRVYNFKLSSAENRHALCAFTGNSITTGYYSGGKGHRYQDVLYGNSSYLYATNAGAGDRLIHVLKDTTEMISLHPKYAFINIGVNDANSGADTVEFRNGYEQLIQSYKHNGIVPVLGTLTPQAVNTVLAYNRAIRGAGVADTLCVVDIWRALVDTNTGTMQTMYNYGDYIHPNTAGNLAMAAAIAREAPFLLADTSDWNNSHQVVALPKGQDRVWVAKFNAAGELLWLNADTTMVPYASLPGNALSCGNAIGTSNGNSVYVGGSLLDAIVNITGTPTTVRDAFVSRFDGNSGERVWQKRWGSNTLDAVTGLGVNPTEQVYITGNFGGEISFGNGTLQSDQANMFVAKLDTDGNELWSRAAAGQAIYSSGLALDPEDSAVLVTGCFNNTATFDSIVASSVAAASFYNYDLFVGRISGTNDKLGVTRFCSAAETLVYPDPAIDQVHIYFGGHAMHKIKVTDVTGRVVYQQSESEQTSTIEVKNWISGLYIISVSSNDGISFHKIVKVQ